MRKKFQMFQCYKYFSVINTIKIIYFIFPLYHIWRIDSKPKAIFRLRPISVHKIFHSIIIITKILITTLNILS